MFTATSEEKTFSLSSLQAKVFGSRITLHGLFWMCIIIFFLIDHTYLIYKASLEHYLVATLVRHVFLMSLVYINLRILLPHFYYKQHVKSYIMLLIFAVTIYISLQNLYDQYLYGKVIKDLERDNFLYTTLDNLITAIWFLVFTLSLQLSARWYTQHQLVKQMQIEKLQAEVKYLRAQINPHFLFNTLNNLYALTLKKSDTAPEIVLKLSEMMDYMLFESNEQKVLLEKEIKNLNNYLELETIRQGNQAEIRFQFTGQINGQKIAPLLLLPLVENAFKHGVNKSVENAFVGILLEVNKQELLFVVKNNKPSQAINEHATHAIGLINLEKRLDLFYKNNYQLSIKDELHTYIVSLKLNLI